MGWVGAAWGFSKAPPLHPYPLRASAGARTSPQHTSAALLLFNTFAPPLFHSSRLLSKAPTPVVPFLYLPLVLTTFLLLLARALPKKDGAAGPNPSSATLTTAYAIICQPCSPDEFHPVPLQAVSIFSLPFAPRSHKELSPVIIRAGAFSYSLTNCSRRLRVTLRLLKIFHSYFSSDAKQQCPKHKTILSSLGLE